MHAIHMVAFSGSGSHCWLLNAGGETNSTTAQLLQAGHSATSASNHSATQPTLADERQLELDVDELEAQLSGMPLP